ncbi:MAG: pyrrolidone-carboxylate peptidase [Nitrososphaerales archaeon]
MPILVFGFEPFLEFDENPTQLLVQRLDARTFKGVRVTGVVLPVDYERAERSITRAIDSVKPELAVGFGLAAGREKVMPEKIAVNYRFAEKGDNAGRKMAGSPIDASGPDGLFTNLPVEGLVASLNEHGIPASLSLSAGSYVCNNAMFVIVREARRRGFAGGFVHVPCHSEWIAKKKKQMPSLPLETLQRGAEHCITYCLRQRNEKERSRGMKVN